MNDEMYLLFTVSCRFTRYSKYYAFAKSIHANAFRLKFGRFFSIGSGPDGSSGIFFLSYLGKQLINYQALGSRGQHMNARRNAFTSG